MLTMPIRIRQCRRGVLFSQAQLAGHVGVGRSAVAQWERPQGASPSVEHLANIAAATGVSFEWLATGRGAMRMQPDQHVPTLQPDDFAQDEVEARCLQLLRRLPERHRVMACRIVESMGR
jgi:transcriptional regulator with XRE-family HTH domain